MSSAKQTGLVIAPKKRKQASEPIVKVKKTRNGTGHRKWTPEEIEDVLNYLKETLQRNQQIERPTVAAYYDKMNESLKLLDVSPIKFKSKVDNLKKQYQNALEWRSKTGAGVLETDGEESVRAYVLKRCPYFDLLDEIFGTKVNIIPPYIHNTNEPDVELDLLYELDISSPNTPSEPETPAEERHVAEEKHVTEKNLLPNKSQKPWKVRRDGLSALTDANSQRAEASKAKVEFETKRLEAESKWKSDQIEIEQRRLLLEEKKHAEELDFRRMELEKQERIEKYKIDQDFKLQLELAKLKHTL